MPASAKRGRARTALAVETEGRMTCGQLATGGGSEHPSDASVLPSPVVRTVGRAAGPKGRDGASKASGGALSPTGKTRSRPRCISALILDGGTAFVARFDARGWRPELRSLFESGTGRKTVTLEGAPTRHATARLSASGARLVLHFERSAFVIVDRVTGRIEVQAKAEALWAFGFEQWAAAWLGWMSYVAAGRACSARTAYAVGWRTHRVELCSDFVDLPIRRADAGNFSTSAKPQTIEKTRKAERIDTFGRSNDAAETVGLGRRSARTSLSIHDKTNQLRAVKHVRPEASFYAAVWRQSPYFRAGAPITRVELRFAANGLRFRTTAGEAIDLRDPAALLDRRNLALVWAGETERRRLLVPGTSRRVRRRRVDARWRVVQSAAGKSVPQARLFQDRSVQQLSHAEQRKNAARRVLQGAQSYASLRGGRTAHLGTLSRAAALAVTEAGLVAPHGSIEAFNARLAARHAFVASEAEAARSALFTELFGRTEDDPV